MKTDRELVEAAAKAACNGAQWYEGLGMCIDLGLSIPLFWNPLTDDGDALRLAAQLRLQISPRFEATTSGDRYAVLAEQPAWHGKGEAWGRDVCAATRRAIVLAAAVMVGAPAVGAA